MSLVFGCAVTKIHLTRLLAIAVLAAYMLCGLYIPAFADAPIPASELKALTEYSQWVPCAGSTSGGGGTTSGTASGGSYSFTSPQQGWIDTDVNWGPMAGGGDASKTSFVALSSEEAAKTNPNMQPGDIIVLTLKGKVAYAIYGDSAASRSASSPYPHGFGDGTQYLEVSPHVATTLTGTADNLPPGVQVTLYPGTAHLLGSSNADQRDQSKIDQVGAQLSGAGSAGGATTSTSSSSGSTCCPPSGSGVTPATPSATSSTGGGKYSAIVSTGASFAGVDQGIDFVPAGSGGFDIYAPGSGKITLADATGHSFQRTSGTAEIVMQLDQKPNAPNSSDFVYFAEIIKLNSATKVGAHFNKGDVIGHNDQSPGIEVGWGRDATHGFPCSIGGVTPCGTSFNNWIQAGGGSNAGGGAASGATDTQQCCGADSGSSTLTGKDNKEKIWNFFKSKGLSDMQVAALMGNFEQESTYNPLEIESDGNTKDPSNISVGWGLVQWTPGSKVLAEATANHISGPIYELATQLDLVWSEMTVTHFGGFDLNAFKSQSSLPAATDYFTSNFEHAGVVGPRLQYAVQALKDFGGQGAASGGSSGSTASGGGCPGAGGSPGYQNPLRDVKQIWFRRIDQGVDYGGVGPVYAIGNGTVDLVCAGGGCGWPTPPGKGGWVSYTLSDGKAKGLHVYVAESCTPIVKKGDPVTSTTKICDMDGMVYPWIETGWASGTGESPLAQTYGGNGSTSTYAGLNFGDLMNSLGAPKASPDTMNGGKLPASFPTWP